MTTQSLCCSIQEGKKYQVFFSPSDCILGLYREAEIIILVHCTIFFSTGLWSPPVCSASVALRIGLDYHRLHMCYTKSNKFSYLGMPISESLCVYSLYSKNQPPSKASELYVTTLLQNKDGNTKTVPAIINSDILIFLICTRSFRNEVTFLIQQFKKSLIHQWCLQWIFSCCILGIELI